MKVKYTGNSHVRKLSKADLVRHGVEDQGHVEWNESNDWTAEVSDSAGQKLLELDSEFQEVKETDEDSSESNRSSKASTTEVLGEEALSPDAQSKAKGSNSGQVSPGAVSGSTGSAGTTTGGRSAGTPS